MKKVMFAAVVAAGIAAFGIESANVVGYYDKAKVSGYNFACYGSMFVKPGVTSYSLADLSITGPGNKNIARMNYIQFFAAGNAAKFDAARSYYYFGGSWFARTGTNVATDPEVADPSAITMDAGVGFLAALPLASAKIRYAGEVISASEKTLVLAKPTGVNFFVANNPSVSDITLADITITGPGNKNIARMNYIQFFAAGNAAKFDAARSYYYFGGSWFARTGTNVATDPEIDPTTVTIGAGEGFLVAFPLATARLNFPTSL